VIEPESRSAFEEIASETVFQGAALNIHSFAMWFGKKGRRPVARYTLPADAPRTLDALNPRSHSQP